MVKFVPAWDKRTGHKLPNDVPQKWLRKGTFPHLADSQQAAAGAQRSGTGRSEKKEG